MIYEYGCIWYQIVALLPDPILPRWVYGRSSNCMHFWIANVLDDDRDAEFPNKELLVIRAWDKLPVLVEISNCVDGLEMLVVD